jgi:hypothetical protein
MSSVRVLVGTRKDAFVLTSDAKRKGGLVMSRITGPVRFAGSITQGPSSHLCVLQQPRRGVPRAASLRQ